MQRYGMGQRALAIGLAFLAGFVDAIGFSALGGLFVSFMSGNSTRLAVSLVAQPRPAFTAAALILAFVAGVVCGALVGRLSGAWRKPAVLALVALLLLLAAGIATLGADVTPPILLMAMAMGAANDVFQRNGEVSIGVTYMTGTLVKVGQHLAAALAGGPAMAWLPYLLLWLGLVAGAVAGAAAFTVLHLGALWIAVAMAIVLAGGAAGFRRG